jgi:phospholipid transport system transporter-binding protein
MFRPTASLTVTNATSALEAGLQAIAEGQTEIDLADVTAVDSVAVATLLAWQRAASERGAALTFNNLPANLRSLVAVYGVADLLHFVSTTETAGESVG